MSRSGTRGTPHGTHHPNPASLLPPLNLRHSVPETTRGGAKGNAAAPSLTSPARVGHVTDTEKEGASKEMRRNEKEGMAKLELDHLLRRDNLTQRDNITQRASVAIEGSSAATRKDLQARSHLGLHKSGAVTVGFSLACSLMSLHNY